MGSTFTAAMARILIKEVESLLETKYHINIKIADADDNLRYHIIGNETYHKYFFWLSFHIFLAKLILSVIGIKFIIAGNLLMAYDLTWNIKSIPVLIGNHTQSQHGKSQVSSIEIGKRTKLVR